MRLLVMADSHGNVDNVVEAINSFDFDYLIFVGDGIGDILDLGVEKEKMIMVKGNNDDTNIIPDEMTLEIEGKVFYITHGHQFGVKFGLNKLIERATQVDADVIIYAHTHIPTQIKLENGMICINPGSIGKGRLGNNSFCVIDIDKSTNQFTSNICQIY